MQTRKSDVIPGGGGRTIYMGAGNPSLLLRVGVHHDQGRHTKSCPEPGTADCAFFTSGKYSSAVLVTYSEKEALQASVSHFFLLSLKANEPKT